MEKEIYFHVGLGKTASTFLQKQVFPYFEGVEYIHRNHRYKRAKEIIKESDASKFFISREFDQQFEDVLTEYATHFPDTTIIIVFRKQGGWIASQYRRFVKSGLLIPFKDFFDLEGDTGVFKKHDLEYMRYIKIVEKNFTKKPLVLFYEDLRKSPVNFIDRFATKMKVTYDVTKINLKTRHSSYSEKQLKALMRVGEFVSLRKDNRKTYWAYQFVRFYTNALRYNTLFIAKFLPNQWFDKDSLIPLSDLSEVEGFYANDWKLVKEYAKKNNPS